MFKEIRKKVGQIPYGRVTTYKAIGNSLGISDYRLVGWALMGNNNINIPCHRVIMSSGEVAKNYSLGDWREQKRRLEKEGIHFTNAMRVDLKKHFWEPSKED